MNRSQALQTLHLSNSCSEGDVKKQYRKMAMKYHPDKNQEPGSEDTFKKISEAYQVLTNPQKQHVQINHHDLFRQMFQMHHPMHPMHQMQSFGGSQIHINMGGPRNHNITSKQISVSYQNGKKITRIQETTNGITRVRIIEE